MSTTSVIAQGIVQIVAEGIDAVFDSVTRLAEAAQSTTNALGRMSGAITRNIGRGLAAGFDAVGKSMYGIYLLIEKIRQGFSSIRFAVRGINHLFSLFAAVATGALGSLFYMAAKNSQEFGDFKDALKDLADAVGATLAPYLRAITAILRGVTQAYESLNPALRQTITNTIVLTVIVSQLATALITRLTSALTGITKLVAIAFHILTAPFRVLGSMLGFLAETLFNIAGTIIQTVTPVLGTLIVVLAEIARRVVLLGFVFFNALIEPTLHLATAIGQVLIVALSQLIIMIIKVSSLMITGLAQAILGVLNSISVAVGLFAVMAAALISNFVVLAASMASMAALIVVSVAAISIAVGLVVAGLQLMGTLAVAALEGLKNAVEGAANGIVFLRDGIVDLVKKGVHGLPLLKNAIWDFVHNIRDDLPGAIKTVIMGLGNMYNSVIGVLETVGTKSKEIFKEIKFSVIDTLSQIQITILEVFADMNMWARNFLSGQEKGVLAAINRFNPLALGIAAAVGKATQGSVKALQDAQNKRINAIRDHRAPVDPVDLQGMKINMEEWERGVDKIIAKMRAFAPQLADWFKRGKGFAMDMLGVFMNLMQPGGFNEKSKSKFESLDQTWQRMVTADQGREREGLDLVKAIRDGLAKHFPDLLAKIDKALPAIRK